MANGYLPDSVVVVVASSSSSSWVNDCGVDDRVAVPRVASSSSPCFDRRRTGRVVESIAEGDGTDNDNRTCSGCCGVVVVDESCFVVVVAKVR